MQQEVEIEGDLQPTPLPVLSEHQRTHNVDTLGEPALAIPDAFTAVASRAAAPVASDENTAEPRDIPVETEQPDATAELGTRFFTVLCPQYHTELVQIVFRIPGTSLDEALHEVRGYFLFLDGRQGDDDLTEEHGESEVGAVTAHFIVLIPDCLPEHVAFALPENLTVPEVLNIISDEIDEQRSLYYPTLQEANPQPDRHWGTVIASPPWAGDIAIGCFDTRQIDGRLFALEVPRRATAEQLCRIAKLDDADTIAVFAYGSHLPLAPGEHAVYIPGGVVVFVPRPAQVPRLCNLEWILERPFLWDADPEMPYGAVGHHFCCVTGCNRLVTHDRNQHGTLHTAIARTLQFAEDMILVRAADPTVADAAINGHHCLNVIAAIPRVAWPHGVPPVFGLLDCRPILQGWSLIEAPAGRATYSDIVSVLDIFAPEGWISQIDPVGIDDNGQFQVREGQVFTASYAPVSDDEDAPPESSAAVPVLSDTQSEEDEVDLSVGHNNRGQRSRSRSPHGAALGVLSAQRRDLAHHQTSVTAAKRSDSQIESPPVGQAHSASIAITELPSSRVAKHFSSSCSERFSYTCRLASVLLRERLPFLQDSHSLEDAFTAVCRATGLPGIPWVVSHNLGPHKESHSSAQWRETNLPLLDGGTIVPWVYTAPPDRLPDAITGPQGGTADSEHNAESLRATFYVVALGYQPQRVDVDLSVPTVPAAVLAEVRTNRSQPDRRRFPVLTAVHPQSLPGVGVFLSEPMWDVDSPHFCVDTVAIDGRFYVSTGRTVADRYALLLAADLPLNAQVDIYVGDSDLPLQDGQDWLVVHGAVVSFVPLQSQMPSRSSLRAVLQDTSFWLNEPFQPLQVQADTYCLVHDSQSILHLSGGDPPMHYRRRIAACIGSAENRLRLFPARPSVNDAEVKGFPVLTVVGVAELGGEFTRSSSCVLLDARPLHGTWHELHVHNGRLDCRALCDDIDRSAPAGWRTVLVGIPSGADSHQVTPGRVIVAEYVPTVPVRAAAPTVTAPPLGHQNSSDGSVATPGPQSDGAQATPGSNAARGDGEEYTNSEQAHSAPLAQPTPARTGSDPPAYMNCIFLICGQNYCPEVAEVRLAVGTSPEEALQAVNAARAPDLRCYLPNLYVAHQQSIEGIAVLVAGPLWPISGAIVVVDATRTTGQVSAVHLPGIADASGSHGVELWLARDVLKVAIAVCNCCGTCTYSTGDLNSRFIQPMHNRVGEKLWETGEDYTWLAPGSGASSRIDFIIIPCSWDVSTGGSCVHHEVDFGQAGADHFAVSVDVRAWMHTKRGNKRASPRLNRACFKDPASQETIQQICDSIPEVGWEVDAHTHYSIVADHLSSRLAIAFPAQSKPCRRSFFTPATWDLRQRRVELRKHLSWANRNIRTAELAGSFCAWIGIDTLGSQLCRRIAALLRALHTATKGVAELRRLQPVLRRSIQHDRKAYLHEVAKSAATSHTKDVVAKLRPLLGPPKRQCRGVQALPMIRLEDGTFAEDKDSADQRWLRHFSAVESGQPVDVQTLIADCLERQQKADTDSLCLERVDLPTRLDLERSMRSAQCGKAVGNDGVVPDLLHLQAAALARPVYQIFLKVAFRLQEPIAWKGGTLHSIWKGRGDQADCENYRAILVSSSIGKAVHGMFRAKCSPYLERACTPMQIGGRKGQPVQIATHAIRAFQKACVDRRKSWAILFVDLREAFHRVVRPLIHGGDLSDEHLAGVIKEIGLPPQSVHQLHAYARDHSLLEDAGASDWTSQVMKEFMEDTWVTYGNSAHIAAVTAGTRPGDNLADLVFTFLFAEILHRVRAKFQELGISVSIPWHPAWLCQPKHAVAADTCSPVDATWMDDLSVVTSDNSAQKLVGKLQLATCITLEECPKAALLPNLRAGKTEALVALYGPGSTTLAKEIFQGKTPQLPIDSHLWPQARLGLASSYKHLGGLLHARGGLKVEIRARLGSAWQAFNKHRKQVFASPIVRVSEKAVLFSSLVDSTLYYGSGTWSGVTSADVARLQSNLVDMARCIVGNGRGRPPDCHESHLSLLASARIPTVATSLHVERLRHFKSTVLKATAELWAILHHESGWIAEVQASLKWLSDMHRQAGSCPPYWDDWTTAVTYIREQPEAWKRAINKARQTAILNELWQAELQKYRGLAFRAFLKAGACLPHDVTQRASSPEVCGRCGIVFDDLRAWSHHAFKRHGRLNPVRRLAHGTQCAVCLGQFRANQGLCNHLTYSRKCRHALINAGFEGIVEPGVGSKKFDQGKKVLLPAVRAQGPQGQWDFTPAVDEQDQPSDAILCRLEDCFCNEGEAYTDWSTLVEAIRAIFCGECLQLSRLKATARQWSQQLQAEIDRDEEWEIRWVSWHLRLSRLLQEVDFVEWLSDEGCTPSLVTSTFRDAEILTPWLELHNVAVTSVPVPVSWGWCFSGTGVLPPWAECPPDCIRDTLDGGNWIDADRTDGLIFLSGAGLRVSFCPPQPMRSFKSLSTPLQHLRLLSDAVRGTFHLWTKRVPACILLPETSCQTVEVVRKCAPFRLHSDEGELFANFCPQDCPLVRFTS
ncbi:unnamed protein product [Symbiodinium sp. CCMP2592]|nr:unnamed protein product [Symbiodinium sp. CCMP2592]